MSRAARTTLERHWLLLQRLPRSPQRVTAAALAEALTDAGHAISKRSVERDLQQLSAQFPIEVDERARPYGWSWHRDAPSFSVPGMSPLQAVVLLTAEAHLKPLLPASQLAELRSLLDQARRTITATPAHAILGPWPDRIAVASTTQPLLAPVVDESVLIAIHAGLYQGRQLDVTYRGRYEPAAKSYRLHPLGLIQRGGVAYLAARIFDYADARLLALHRFQCATLLDAKVRIPPGFRLSQLLPEVNSGFDQGKPIRLRLRMSSAAARHLADTPLSANQTISGEDADRRVVVSASVDNTAQLRWWLLGFGGELEVLAPVGLRREIARQLCEAAGYYAER